MAEDKALELLLTHKLAMLDLTANTSMTWWVSSIVFGAAIIAAVFTHKTKLCKLPGINIICFFITLFFASFPAYGLWIVHCNDRLLEELIALLTEYKRGSTGLYEFTTVKVALYMGTFNFILLLVAWLWLWYLIVTERKQYLANHLPGSQADLR
jgi:hypothetical protein